MWERASVVQGSGHEHYGAERNNDSVEIAGRVHGDLLRFEHLLAQVFHSCAYAYKALNRHLMLSRDTGYTLLRYQPGQFFHEHIDTIVGHSDYAMRLLSGIIFLNDGFDGGELEFPHQKMKLKPAPGDVLLWPSGFTHPHQAHAIVTGTKFSVVTWFV
jgi:predicted 2-oxoglutarate/Fe(II)-dependent dioxygenase YbiX